MTHIILSIPLILFLYLNYQGFKRKPVFSWVFIFVWVIMSILGFLITAMIAKDLSSLASTEILTIYLILTTIVVIGNITVSLVSLFKN
jgi:hypothetical protein